MKKKMSIALLTLMPLASYAACVVAPLTTDYLANDKNIYGQISKDDECKGYGSRASYLADIFSFQGKLGDEISGYVNSAGTYSFILLDPAGSQIADFYSGGVNFKRKLLVDGTYKVVIAPWKSEDKNAENGIIQYGFSLKSSSPTQTNPPIGSCPTDTYVNGKLSMPSVSVPDGFGGTSKYKVEMSLQPLSNPTAFTLDSATPIQ